MVVGGKDIDGKPNQKTLNDYDKKLKSITIQTPMCMDIVDGDIIERYMAVPYDLGYEYPEIPDNQKDYRVTAQALQTYTKQIGHITDEYIDSQVAYLESKHEKRLDTHDAKIDRLKDRIYDSRIMFIFGIIISFILSLTIMAVTLEYEIKPEIVEQVRMEMLAEEEARNEET